MSKISNTLLGVVGDLYGAPPQFGGLDTRGVATRVKVTPPGIFHGVTCARGQRPTIYGPTTTIPEIMVNPLFFAPRGPWDPFGPRGWIYGLGYTESSALSRFQVREPSSEVLSFPRTHIYPFLVIFTFSHPLGEGWYLGPKARARWSHGTMPV